MSVGVSKAVITHLSGRKQDTMHCGAAKRSQDASVRFAAISALKGLYTNPANVAGMRDFKVSKSLAFASGLPGLSGVGPSGLANSTLRHRDSGLLTSLDRNEYKYQHRAE
eukprot:scaffold15355_cov21-Tisochrysis_lutea.AAC.3